MDNIDEIINESKESKSKKDEWVKNKKLEKEKLFEKIDTTSKMIIEDSNLFKNYLDILSKFDKYSISNSLLILDQQPDASLLKDKDEWISLEGIKLKKKPKTISLLKPGEAYTKKDGTIIKPFNIYEMIDISQTDMKLYEKKKIFDDKVMLKAFLYDCPVDIKVDDYLKNNKASYWDSKKGLLYIQRGANPNSLFLDISKELSKVNLGTNDKDASEFKSKCASYIICKKNGIDVSNYHFEDIPESFKSMEAKDIRNELSSIKEVVSDFNNRVNIYMDSLYRKSRSKDMER